MSPVFHLFKLTTTPNSLKLLFFLLSLYYHLFQNGIELETYRLQCTLFRLTSFTYRQVFVFVFLWFDNLCMCAQSLSIVQLCATLWTVACQVPLSMEFFRQENWSGLPCPPPGDLPDPGIELGSLTSPSLVGRFFTASTTWAINNPLYKYTKAS